MDKRMIRNLLIEKENDHKNVNKKEIDPSSKVDRLLMIKKINSLEEKEPREIRHLKNTKECRAVSRSLAEKPNRLELKPLQENITNTQQYCQLYGSRVADHSQGQPLGNFLQGHDIDKGLRARMLDWMIEVTSSYKFTPKTYFSSICLMDRYFSMEDQRIPITKLHIVGVISMLIATKMDEVYPLKIKTVYEKIVHKKIDRTQLVEMEARIADKLDFILNAWTFYDLALFKLHQHSNSKNEESLKQIEDLCHIIAKFVVFNYELYGHYSISVLAEALLRAACRVYGSDKAKLVLGESEGL
jgi:hypothetical protein